MSKGSKPRPMSGTYKQWEENWERIFGKKKEREVVQNNDESLNLSAETIEAVKIAPSFEDAFVIVEKDLRSQGRSSSIHCIKQTIIQICVSTKSNNQELEYKI